MTILDRAATTETTEEAIARVDRNTSDDEREVLLQGLHEVALKHATFTVDQVWDHLGNPDLPSSKMGPVMRIGARNKWMKRVPGEERASARAATHGKPQRVWESLVYGQTTKGTPPQATRGTHDPKAQAETEAQGEIR